MPNLLLPAGTLCKLEDDGYAKLLGEPASDLQCRPLYYPGDPEDFQGITLLYISKLDDK